MKPNGYSAAYTVTAKVDYHCLEPDGDGALPKDGVLQPGRVVWLKGEPDPFVKQVKAYVERVGLINVDSALLHHN